MSEFKSYFQKEWRNLKKDIKLEYYRRWKIEYKGHTIEVVNHFREEQLFIDDKLVDYVKHKHIFFDLKAYTKLHGEIKKDGEILKVQVKIGGYTTLNCFISVNNQIILKEKLQLHFNPWEHKQAIFPFIEEQVKIHSKVVDEVLPDEQYYFLEDDLRFVPGARNRILDDTEPFPFSAKSLFKLLMKQLKEPNAKTRKAIYEKVMDEEFIEYAEKFREMLVKENNINKQSLQNEALWFIEHAAHRYALIFGVVILGITNCEEYKQILHIIGLHEEFTLYVADAFLEGTKNPNENLWTLAKQVNGWGKIACVERLKPDSEEIKNWLLTYGYENAIMNRYLAYTCAIKGELESVLVQPNISEELYDSAGQIIIGLIEEDDIYNYPHASEVLHDYIRHAKKHVVTLEKLYPVVVIQKFLNEEAEMWEERYENEWKLNVKRIIEEEIQLVLKQSKWEQSVLKALNDDENLFIPIEIASELQLDITSILFEKVKRGQLEETIYFELMSSKNSILVEKLVNFIMQTIDLNKMSEEQAECIYIVISYLDEYEGIGLAFIEKCLQLQIIRFEYMALSALTEWEEQYWKNPSTLSIIMTVAKNTKDKENRQMAKALLNKRR